MDPIYKIGAVVDIAVLIWIVILEVILIMNYRKLRFDFITKYVMAVYLVSYIITAIGDT